jgi:hypothetical protein
MKIKFVVILVVAFIFNACNNSPKVISPASNSEKSSTSSGIFSDEQSSKPKVDFNAPMASSEFHEVVVNEVLPASRYMYLNVTEGRDTFWIVTRLINVKKGETYYYKDGLLKTNYESKEYNRVFDKVYLVSNLVAAANHGSGDASKSVTDYSEKTLNTTKQDIEMHTDRIVKHQGSIKIADLVKDPKKYEGKTVQLDGICTKVNPGIMDRNWIHIKDGSKDDYDLVVTSDAYVPEGSVVTIKATVSLNKDFGAGYKYDLILEQGEIIK